MVVVLFNINLFEVRIGSQSDRPAAWWGGVVGWRGGVEVWEPTEMLLGIGFATACKCGQIFSEPLRVLKFGDPWQVGPDPRTHEARDEPVAISAFYLHT